jgi:uncharacterized protein YbjT (DUF2867 family)
MNVLLFGATGMVGQGVLREALIDPRVTRVLVVGRSSIGRQDPKLRELVVPDVANLSAIESELTGLDVCLFCLGVSSAGMTEAQYTRLTYDLTLAIAATLARLNPAMTFVYVSGAGTDGTERGRVMWARVKGRTENALLRLPFKAAYMVRPGLIIPLHGIRSRTPWVQTLLSVTRPLHPLMQKLGPGVVTTTEQIGRALLTLGRNGYPAHVLEMRDINAL